MRIAAVHVAFSMALAMSPQPLLRGIENSLSGSTGIYTNATWEIIMKSLSKMAISTFAAIAFIAASAQAPAQAGGKGERIIAGILLGALGGAIIASEINRRHDRRRDRRHYGHRYHSDHVYDDDIYVEPRKTRRVRHSKRLSRWERHVRRCSRKYRTYDERSDTYITRNGRERVCRL